MLEVHNTISFTEHNGKTTLTLQAVVRRMEPGMGKALSGMDQGWTESLERLAQLVESMQTK